MKVLVWQWGRRGAGPRIAVELACALQQVAETSAVLSLSDGAEILGGAAAPVCDLPVSTYSSGLGFLARLLLAPVMIVSLVMDLRRLRPDVAICAMPGPLDLLMAAALAVTRTSFLVIVHDADSHPGEHAPLLMWLQRRLIGRASALVALSLHVANRLREQGLAEGNRPVVVLRHPPMAFGALPPPPFAHAGPPRLLFFGRLLAYKGLDLLSEALVLLGPSFAEIRVVGSGPEGEALNALRALSFVTVENRWVPEDEIAAVIGWADVLVLPYREASQSGAAAVAIAAGRWVVATRVGGLAEQLLDESLAVLCDPDAASLAGAMRSLCTARPVIHHRGAVADAGWREFATGLVASIDRQMRTNP